MSSSSDRRISEERARAIWQRAARLQAEAERRMEERARALPAATEAGADEDGLRAGEVEAAALEAGIDPEYVRIAMAEAAALPPVAPMGRWEERAATRFLGVVERSLELSRVVDAPPAPVVEAALRVFPAHPCLLKLRDVVEISSDGGRAIVFDMLRYDWGATSNPPFVENAWMIGLRRIHVLVRPAPDRGGSEVVLSGDLEPGVRGNWRIGSVTSAAMGALGGGAGVAFALSAALPAALVALPVLGGFAALGGLTAAAWGPLYRYYLRRTTEALDDTLDSLAAAVRTQSNEARRLPEPGPR